VAAPMKEPVITCPNCKTEVKLTESRTALLLPTSHCIPREAHPESCLHRPPGGQLVHGPVATRQRHGIDRQRAFKRLD